MNDVRKKLYNIEILVEEIREFPQTYKTILRDLCKDGTCQTILRRKLSRLYKSGTLCKSVIPGTRFGQAIVYALPKKYHILVEGSRISGSRVYCFFGYKKLSRFYIEVEECWVLEDNFWQKVFGKKRFFAGNTLKWI